MKPLSALCRLFLTGCFLSALHAQETVIPDSIITVGTTTLDSAGKPMAYVTLASPQPETLRGRNFGVWVKPAAAQAAGEFTFQGTIQPILDPSATSAMLDRAVRLGQPRADAESAIRYLYRKAKYPNYLASLHKPRQPGDPPWPDDPAQPGEPSTAEQAALVATRGENDPVLSGELDLASLVSPGIALIHGRAWAGALPATGQNVTIELRRRENGVDGAVIGRVELQAGVPIALPAPGTPLQVPDKTNAGDLSIGLRWACPPDLRRLSLLNPGFKLYRATTAFAETSDMVNSPPDAATLAGLSALPDPQVIQLSSGIILPSRIFTETDVSDFSPGPDGSASPTFLIDRNQSCCGQADRDPFRDGDKFYYFAVACDILGQPGLVSRGGLGMACSRVVPFTPGGLRISADPLTAPPAITLSWDASQGGKTSPTSFEILRGTGSRGTNPDGTLIPDPRVSAAAKINDGMVLEKSDPSLLTRCGSIDLPAPGTPARITWTDPAPFISSGQTCWYTVRAVFKGACGTLYSDPAAPVYATLRKLDAPAPPVLCYQGNGFPFAVVKYQTTTSESASYPANEYRLRLKCARENTSISHVNFEVRDGSGTLLWQQMSYFPDTRGQGATPADVPVLITGLAEAPSRPTVTCTAYSNTGAASRPATINVTLPAAPSNSLTKTSQPVVNFVAGGFSLAALPPATSFLRDAVVSTTTVSGVATLPAPAPGTTAAVNRLATAAINLGTLPLQPPGEDRVPSVLLEKAVPGGGWATLGGARVSNGMVIVPGGYTGALRATLLKVYPPAGCEGMVHQTGDGAAATAPVTLGLCLSENTREYRLYREIDDSVTSPHEATKPGSTMRLIGQGPARADDGMLALADTALPAVSANVQYYAQLINGNGNASPLTALLSCPLKIIAPPPIPVLSRVRAATLTDLGVEWYCPSPGVERFQVFVETSMSHLNPAFVIALPSQLRNLNLPLGDAPSAPPLYGLSEVPLSGNASHILSRQANPLSPLLASLLNTRSYYTSRVGSGENALGTGPEYLQKIAVNPVGKFKVWVKSIGPTGGVSAPSNVIEFTWRNPVADFPSPESRVPWPARALPGSIDGAAFDHPIRVVPIPSTPGTLTIDGVTGMFSTLSPDNTAEKYLRGVRIGTVSGPGSKDFQYNRTTHVLTLTAVDRLGGKNNPNTYLSLLNADPASPALPAVLYRRQIPSTEFPAPAGDIIQVSPLITRIAWYSNNGSVIVDPYIAILSSGFPVQGDLTPYLNFCILDTQPVIESAAYEYFLVRFNAQGEMRDVVHAGTTTIEAQP